MSSIVDAYCCCLLNVLEETFTLHVRKYKQFRQQSIPRSIVLVNTFFVRLKHIYAFMLFIPEDTIENIYTASKCQPDSVK